MSKVKIIYLALLGFCFIGGIVSLFFPYLIKLNVRSGNLDLPKIKYGYEYSLPAFSLALYPFLFLIEKLTERISIALIFSLFNLGFVYLTRKTIHFQSFIDHDFDSKTGLGYHLIFTFSILQFIFTMIYCIIAVKKTKIHV